MQNILRKYILYITFKYGLCLMIINENHHSPYLKVFMVFRFTYNKATKLTIAQNPSEIIDNLHGDRDSANVPETNQ